MMIFCRAGNERRAIGDSLPVLCSGVPWSGRPHQYFGSVSGRVSTEPLPGHTSKLHDSKLDASMWDADGLIPQRDFHVLRNS